MQRKYESPGDGRSWYGIIFDGAIAIAILIGLYHGAMDMFARCTTSLL